MALPTIVYGAASTLDLLASNQQTIAQIGEDRAFQAIQDTLDAHNRIFAELRQAFAEETTERQRRYGGPVQMDMTELDEFGTPETQKVTAGSLVGFPLKQYGRALEWTRLYFRRATGAELAAQVKGLMDADLLNLIRQVKTALYSPLNYTTDDRLRDHQDTIPIAVKALANADGAPIPVGPNGEFFDGATHTHYLVCATPGTLANADLLAGLNTVIEHFASGTAVIYINTAQESAVRAMADFTAMVDAQIVQGANVTYARGDLDTRAIYNRQIGVFRGAPLWVKPWVISGYPIVLMQGQVKPLAYRYDPLVYPDLELVYDNETFPLRARAYTRAFGVGVWNRVAAAVIDVAHGTYTAPTIT